MASNTVTFVAILSILVYLASNKDGANAVSGSVQFTVAAFNIQNFSENKVNNAQVLDVIVRILSRYDVVLVQEIRDKNESPTLFPKFLAALNSAQSRGNDYKYISGPPLPDDGRSHTEKYVYFYRESKLKLVDQFTYPDAKSYFVRDPFVAVFETASKTKLGRFALVGIHTPPNDAVKELKNLHLVAELVASNPTPPRKISAQNIILMGDFNAGGTYVKTGDWPTIPLYSQSSKYTWLIGNSVKTTLTGYPYDRIVVTNNEMKSSIVAGSAKAFEFDKEPNYPASVLPKTVSDHYPVEVTITSALV